MNFLKRALSPASRRRAGTVGMAMLMSALTVAVPSVAQADVVRGSVSAAAAPTVSRVSGVDRYDTAVKISQKGYPSASIVYVATGADYPDALAAAPAAALSGAPLLLTTPDALRADVRDEIIRLKPSTIRILGGERAVSPAVHNALALIAPVERLAGSDRFETSRMIAQTVFGKAATAFLATGANYPDALAASAAAGAMSAPVILVDGRFTAVEPRTTEVLGALGVTKVIIAGGAAAVPQQTEQTLRSSGLTVQRAAGSDRYATAVAVNTIAFPSASEAFLATGVGFSDALAGAALAGKRKAPLYLSLDSCLPTGTATDIKTRLAVGSVTLLGGTSVLRDSVATLVDCPAWYAAEKLRSEKELTSKLNARMSSLAGSYSVAVREISGLQRSVSIRGADMKEPASSIKLFPAYVALKLIDDGKLSLGSRTSSGTTVRDCLRVMIHISDNPCHTELIALLGQQNLNDLFVREGYTRTHYTGWSNGVRYDAKHSTADDLALLLTRLNAGTLLSPSGTEHLLSLMRSQIWRTRVAGGIPPGVVQASKIGSLWMQGSGMVDTDAAIVYAPNGTFVMSVMGSAGASAPSNAALARVVYEHFNGAFGAAASYPTQQMYATTNVTFYSGAGTGALATIPSGTWLEAIDSVRVWYRVKYNGRTGYVNSYYLANR
ncbi:cell wall-binding repeat-containing protein [Mycetocola sp. 2940]|uniref:cell wall-binding repeat-containing protein n=1 Tax=Mycetocola sp. 2940 TaxID=3156452 RepID=UPI0033997022